MVYTWYHMGASFQYNACLFKGSSSIKVYEICDMNTTEYKKPLSESYCVNIMLNFENFQLTLINVSV